MRTLYAGSMLAGATMILIGLFWPGGPADFHRLCTLLGFGVLAVSVLAWIGTLLGNAIRKMEEKK